MEGKEHRVEADNDTTPTDQKGGDVAPETQGLRRRVVNEPPILEQNLPSDVILLRNPYTSAYVYIIGTVHVSKKSVSLVREIIQKATPDCVMVELCMSRSSLVSLAAEEDFGKDTARSKQEKTTFADILNSIKSGEKQKAMTQLLVMVISNMIQDLDSEIGGEIVAAAEEARKLSVPLILGDRSLPITLARAWHYLSFIERLMGILMFELLWSSKITKEELEMLEGDLTDTLFKEFAAHFPGAMSTIVNERDQYLSGSLRCCPGQVVVGVVGKGHLRGIQKYWNDYIDFKTLNQMPPNATRMSWLLPLLVTTGIATAALAGGFALIGGALWWASHQL